MVMAKASLGKFRDILEACRSSKFMSFSLDDRGPTVVSGLSLTPVGKMLRNNLRQESHQLLGGTAVPVYRGTGSMSLAENLHFLHQNYPLSLPFGVALEVNGSEHRSFEVPLQTATSGLQVERTMIDLCTTYLIAPSLAAQFLHQTQRQRKIWWMRFSSGPGRYQISDAQSSNDGERTVVAIRARFGNTERATSTEQPATQELAQTIDLEWLELFPRGLLKGSDIPEELYIRTKGKPKKTFPPAVVRVHQDLDRATLAVLMDALEPAPFSGCVRVHRKLAPFKCGIICNVKDRARQAEVEDLAKHLAIVLRKADISLLDYSLPQAKDVGSYRKQIANLDALGVPYTLVLRDEALETGLLSLRARDTTLAETIHVSDLPHYLIKIIQS
ncbi:DNA polymerase subunit gamma-2, mitochondrial [Anopheles cruzii]|uniref:DNA polymerase subunit gamma-2, mitochondrial n=1 Tax=Anopheles cruzii TaxID=68878 RepID=UPI0022EC5F8F|nr:DNA polymerase subunit gamma-2, mitochondrial [Anopheles cruzii]